MHATIPPRLEETQGATPFDYRAIYAMFRDRAWVIALCFLAAALGTATVLERSPSIYESKTVLLVEPANTKVVDIQRVQADEYQSIEALKTVEQTLENDGLVERVIDANDLGHDPRLGVPPGTAPLTREQQVAKLSAMIEVKLRRGTRLIDITVDHTDPAFTTLVANSLVTEFLRQDYEEGSASLHTASDFLEAEAGQVKQKLDDSENALQVYKEQTHSISSADAQNIVVQELDALSVKATEAKSKRIAAETAYKEVQALGSDVNALMVTPAADESPAIQEIRSNLAKTESDLADLKPRYKPRHPKYLEAQSQLSEWKNALNHAVLELPQTALSAYQSAKAAEEALNAALEEQQTAALEMHRNAIRYDFLARDVDSNRALYQTILNQIKDNAVMKDLKISNIRIIQKAEVPDRPVKPDKLKVTSVGIFFALLSSVLLVLFLNHIDQSLKTVSQAEEALGLPVLCAIPKFDGPTDHTALAKIEAFRTLRANLSTLGRKDERRVFLFTSSLPGEGKTFCSLNYALSLARQGLTTLVIDCDMRRPMIEKILRSTKERGAGLTDYLTTHKTLEQVVQVSESENLFFISGGSISPNPVELLANSGFDALVREALTHFDRIVIDSAPMNVVSDTLLILPCIQTVCLVICANRTPQSAARRTTGLLQNAGAPLAGIILNLLPRNAVDGYYHDYVYRQSYSKEAS
jgi:succinoglycan biosynthesis transport protein ExoP